MFITINHIEEYMDIEYFRVGMELLLKKDDDNPYDDEAIAVYTSNMCKCGYVANSVCSVCRGTHSAGYIWQMIDWESKCAVRFISDTFAIAEMV